jgi:pimeloyl-ACP methyl ester carboxylesterase
MISANERVTTEERTDLATYVLVHAAGHGGWSYQKVAKLLRDQGHQVYAPTLSGLAERFHLVGASVDLHCHIRDITGLLRFEDLRDVILVGHGYGGMVITGAADREPQRVGHLVYLDAATPASGQSLLDVAPGIIGALRKDVVTVNGVELCLFPTPEILPYWGVVDFAVLEWMVPRLTPHPWMCLDQPLELTNEDTLRSIPQSHIISGLRSQCRDVDRLRASTDGRVWELDSGHDMVLIEPGRVANKLAATSEWLHEHATFDGHSPGTAT